MWKILRWCNECVDLLRNMSSCFLATLTVVYTNRGGPVIARAKKAQRPAMSGSSGMVHDKMERINRRHVGYKRKEDFNIHKLVLYLNTLVH